MAEVFKRVESGPFKGKNILRAVAGSEEVVGGIDRTAHYIAEDARQILRETRGHPKHNPGHSNAPARISVELAFDESRVGRGRKRGRFGYIDRFVVLSDERGMGAAMAIEFGIRPGIGEDGRFYPGTRPVAPLRRAAELPVRRKSGIRMGRKPNKRSRSVGRR